MVSYAKKWQLLPFVSYLTLFDSNILGSGQKDDRGLSKSDRKKLAAEAFRQGVILIIVTLVDN